MQNSQYIRLTGILLPMALAACSTLQPVPLNISQAPVNDVQLAEVGKSPEQFQNAVVRWGGNILSMEEHDNSLRIEILQRTLLASGKPSPEGPSDGRFVALIRKPHNLKDYHQNRLITVSGVISTTEDRQITPETRQQIPVIDVEHYYVWRPDYDYYDYRYRGSLFYGHGCPHPFYRAYYSPYYCPDFYDYPYRSRPPRYRLYKKKGNGVNQSPASKTNAP